MAVVLLSVVDCEPLKLLKVYEGICLAHVMSKACQHATNDDKILTRLRSVNVKGAHVGL
jgi:hypothetical protein